MPALPRRADRRGDHLIVCGDGPLSYRITEELTSRYDERVTVILPSRRRNYGPQIGALAGVRVLEHPELSSQAFTDADVQSARALAVLWQDDVGNLHAGLRAQELGLGNVGTSVTSQLHDLGFDVVCVDNNPAAAGIPMARQLGLPVVIGDAFREETLRAASLETCLALVSVTSSDIVNLETTLTARALRDDLRIVLRLTDDDLAERMQKTTGNIISRSVPYLAAPAFAAAMLEHQVLRTIAVGRHVLLIADVRAGPGLTGSLISDAEQDGQARVLALQADGAAALDWSPRRGYLLAAGDRMIVLATRKGLGRFLSAN
jgi:Trk K+ transport system NAD-binding subunit